MIDPTVYYLEPAPKNLDEALEKFHFLRSKGITPKCDWLAFSTKKIETVIEVIEHLRPFMIKNGKVHEEWSIHFSPPDENEAIMISKIFNENPGFCDMGSVFTIDTFLDSIDELRKLDLITQKRMIVMGLISSDVIRIVSDWDCLVEWYSINTGYMELFEKDVNYGDIPFGYNLTMEKGKYKIEISQKNLFEDQIAWIEPRWGLKFVHAYG